MVEFENLFFIIYVVMKILIFPLKCHKIFIRSFIHKVLRNNQSTSSCHGNMLEMRLHTS